MYYKELITRIIKKYIWLYTDAYQIYNNEVNEKHIFIFLTFHIRKYVLWYIRKKCLLKMNITILWLIFWTIGWLYIHIYVIQIYLYTHIVPNLYFEVYYWILYITIYKYKYIVTYYSMYEKQQFLLYYLIYCNILAWYIILYIFNIH